MIAVLTLLYLAVLFLAVKLKLIRLTLWWKLSPIVWMLFLTIALIIPMQFYAPGGAVVVGQYSVQVVPNVAGQVVEVPVRPNVPLTKGDVLFRIDPTPYQAAVDDLTAQLALTATRLGQSRPSIPPDPFACESTKVSRPVEGSRSNTAMASSSEPAA